jgi:hypothetical protein
MGALSIKIGEVYGRLTVVSRLKNDGRNRPVFACRCRCGITVPVKSNSLRTGNTRSCGCLKREAIKRTVELHWQKPQGEAALTALLAGYKKDARKRALDFSLPRADFERLTRCRCRFCGQEPANTTNFKTNGNIVYNGIDRLDPALGYTVANSVTCCKHCNRMKGHRTATEFLEWVERIVRRSPRVVRGRKSSAYAH